MIKDLQAPQVTKESKPNTGLSKNMLSEKEAAGRELRNCFMPEGAGIMPEGAELHQKTVHEQTLVNLVGAYNWINSALKKKFDPFGITVQQYNILKILRSQREKPATINLLKDRMLDKMSDASRIVERLVQKNLVSRKICVFDRRAVDISITAEGLALLERMDSSYTAADIVGREIMEEDLTQINVLLERIRNREL